MAVSELDNYRHQARAWLAANLERRKGWNSPTRQRGLDHRTAEGIASQRSIQRALFDGGYAGITWPTEYGGQGLTQMHELVFNEEAEAYNLPDFGVAGRTTILCGKAMLQHASKAFLQRHIPRMLSGEELWVQFLSEPDVGSDLAGVLTRATRDGDRWILNGSKIWSSGAYYADYGMCLARTDWAAPKHRGLTWFAVPIESPGITVQPIRQINGDSEFCQEFLDDVELTDADVIGEVNQGWRVTQTLLTFERSSARMETAAPPKGPDQLAPDLVELARRVGRLQDGHVRQLIARAHVNDVVLDELGHWIDNLVGAGGDDAGALMAYKKLAKGTLDPIRGRIGIEVGGASAIAWDLDNEENLLPSLGYLNSRIQAIAGGTNEMMRNTIGERVLGLPREPSFDRDRSFSEILRSGTNWGREVR